MIGPTSVTGSQRAWQSRPDTSTGHACDLCGEQAWGTYYYRPRRWRAWRVGRLALCGACAMGVAQNAFWIVWRVIRAGEATHRLDEEREAGS